MPPSLAYLSRSEGAEGISWSISDLQAGNKVRQARTSHLMEKTKS